MLIPSIDIMNGNAVQLVGGRTLEIDAGDPRPLAERFGRLGELAIVDLDAAMGTGDNTDLIRSLLPGRRVRVGGGIRDVSSAVRWLDAGAEKVVLGTAARPEVLEALPRDRVVVALDAVDDDVVIEGWTRRTSRTVASRMKELRPFADAFLVTLVEREGRMVGLDRERVNELAEAADGASITLAGGIRDADEIAELDRLGVDAQVGMALYSGAVDLVDAFAAPLRTDRPDGLWPTVVCDESGVALGLAWSNAPSLRLAVETGRGVYWSRSRGELWSKGATSGNEQILRRVDVDCDRDALRFTVSQQGSGFCHVGTPGCWGRDGTLAELRRTLEQRRTGAPPGSYTRRLLDEPELLAAKLSEEAGELARAASSGDVAREAADVLYFTAVAMTRAGVGWSDVEDVLRGRALRVTRRAGDAKEGASS